MKQSRQVQRASIRRILWEQLKGTDFDGEPVAIRDSNGSPIIRRRSKVIIRQMWRLACKRTWQERQKRKEK